MHKQVSVGNLVLSNRMCTVCAMPAVDGAMLILAAGALTDAAGLPQGMLI